MGTSLLFLAILNKNISVYEPIFIINTRKYAFYNLVFFFQKIGFEIDVYCVYAISAIYILNFFWVKKQHYILNERNDWEYPALICWLLSSVIACFTYYDVFQLTHVYFLDSSVVGAVLYYSSIKIKLNYN